MLLVHRILFLLVTIFGTAALYDGVGNVVGLMDAQSGARVASYQYGPFGEGLGVWGERAASCPLRFQTRLYDEETGLCYFGARYYDAQTQTWLSRDPLREAGGVNLYAYCHNDPVGRHDPLGLESFAMVYARAQAAMIHEADYGTEESRRAAEQAMTILPGDARLTPPSVTQRLVTSLAGALAPGPSERDLAESPALPTGSGLGHQAQLYSLSLLSSTAGLVSLGNDPTRLFTGEQSVSARELDEEYRRRFTYGERSAADFNLFIGSLLAPAAAGKAGELAVGTFDEVRSLNLGGRVSVAGGMLRPNRFASQAGSIINPFAELFGDSSRVGMTIRSSAPDVRVPAIHHIATDKNSRFTILFEELFSDASMDLQHPLNKILLENHFGPHGYYNQIVLDRLTSSVRGYTPGTAQFRTRLIGELFRIRSELADPTNPLRGLLSSPASTREILLSQP